MSGMGEAPEGGPSRRERLSLPNLLTVGRIVAIPVIAFLAISSVDLLRALALVLFIAAALTDLLDGLLARLMGQVSDLGRMLDPIADKLLVGALLLVFAFDRSFSVFDLIPALVILLREIFVPGMREYLGMKNIILPVSWLAKYKTAIQLIALGLVMAEPLMPGIRYLSDFVLWLAAVITVWTGFSYWRSMAEHLDNGEAEADPR